MKNLWPKTKNKAAFLTQENMVKNKALLDIMQCSFNKNIVFIVLYISLYKSWYIYFTVFQSEILYFLHNVLQAKTAQNDALLDFTMFTKPDYQHH